MNAGTSTLEGKMSGEDLFGILDLVATLSVVYYMLEEIDQSTGATLTGVPPILRSSIEPIEPGCYRIREGTCFSLHLLIYSRRLLCQHGHRFYPSGFPL